MLPFELIIFGTPLSVQTRRRSNLRAWKENVSRQAKSQWPSREPPLNEDLKVTYVYYYSDSSPDVDNLFKPIQDALESIIFCDDALVTDAISSKRDLKGSYKVMGMSSILAKGFISGKDFVHIKIEAAPDHQELI